MQGPSTWAILHCPPGPQQRAGLEEEQPGPELSAHMGCWCCRWSINQRINAKLHEGVCQRCKEVLEWRVKYSKYKPLSKPKKCVKCLQKTVKDSYHIMCRLCAYELEVCAKCGKKEDIVIPFNKEPEKSENIDSNLSSNCRGNCRRNEESDDDLDFDLDLDDTED
ncbi:uncharacterized protein C9orf85 homolog isoform X4 [Oryctolagus cuniculus]|uniref:uncharacterized protein C9orf85 homolog isoform X4 n=1 Tax=Oryctolagus cuniculus TaxID=9986 RepID=UPI0022321571|nr:uncharacterized protein C9orf85 homolog isoform X4 [Oryctolagus cuniculus]